MYVYKQTIYTYTYTYCQEPYTFIITQFFMLDVHVPNESLFLSNSSQTRGPRAAATTKHHMNANNIVVSKYSSFSEPLKIMYFTNLKVFIKSAFAVINNCKVYPQCVKSLVKQ